MFRWLKRVGSKPVTPLPSTSLPYLFHPFPHLLDLLCIFSKNFSQQQNIHPHFIHFWFLFHPTELPSTVSPLWSIFALIFFYNQNKTFLSVCIGMCLFFLPVFSFLSLASLFLSIVHWSTEGLGSVLVYCFKQWHFHSLTLLLAPTPIKANWWW